MGTTIGQITGAIGGVNQLVQTSGAVVNDVARLGQSLTGTELPDTSGLSFADGSWSQQLQPGSWRGCGFYLDAGDTAAGRRVAIHEYPYRDGAWVEDLGKLPRRFSIQAFIVGDDVYQQRNALLAASEQPGAGTLVHPTLGSIQVVLLEPLQCTDRRERGRVVEVSFSFIVAGDVVYPATATATTQNVGAAASALSTASAGDLGSSLASIGGVVTQATAAVGQFTSMATSVVGDAASVFGSVRGLAGYFGRFSTGSLSAMQSPLATVQTALAATTTARTLVNNTAALVNTLAGAL